MSRKTRSGFTLIEVTIVLGLTGLLLIGILGGTQTSIRNQRYNDSVRSFAEYLRTIYSEVINPQSLGFGNATNYAILGKVVVLGGNSADKQAIYDATLVGKVDLQSTTTGDFITELGSSETSLNIYCGQKINDIDRPSTVRRYEPLWQAEINYANQTDIFAGQKKPSDNTNLSVLNTNSSDLFKGTIIVARSPKSGGIHTIFTPKTYDLANDCRDSDHSAASEQLRQDLQHFVSGTGGTSVPEFGYATIGFCVESENAHGAVREIRLAKDGRNTSAISLIDVNPDNGEVNQCQP